MKLAPLFDRVVLKQLVAEETTKSGIVLPGQAKEKPQQAEVIAVGPGGVVEGKEVTMQVKVGDKVIFSVLPGAGTVKRPNVEDGDWELLTPCVTEMGVTYLAASDLSLLLDLYFYNT